jgi:hypothetical protein
VALFAEHNIESKLAQVARLDNSGSAASIFSSKRDVAAGMCFYTNLRDHRKI